MATRITAVAERMSVLSLNTVVLNNFSPIIPARRGRFLNSFVFYARFTAKIKNLTNAAVRSFAVNFQLFAVTLIYLGQAELITV